MIVSLTNQFPFLGVQVFDFGGTHVTPEHVEGAGKAAIDANFSHYTGMSALLALRDAAASRACG